MRTKRVASVLAAATMAVASVAHADTGETTGTKIGTIIKDTIETAFPAVSTIVDLISPGKKDDDDIKIKKAELETKLEESQKAAKEKVVAKFSGVEEIVAELDVMGQFLRPVIESRELVVRMQARAGADQNADYWRDQGIDWEEVTGQLSRLKTVSGVENIQSAWLRTKLVQIRESNLGVSIRVKAAIKDKRQDELLEQLALLQDRLNDIHLVTTAMLGDLNRGFKAALKASKGDVGGSIEKSRDRRDVWSDARDRLDRTYSESEGSR